MTEGRTQIPIVQGRQLWQLARTSRDGASAAELPQMTAAAVRHMLLTEAFEGKGAKHELTQTGENEWRFGNVRPLKVLEVKQQEFPLPMPKGKVLADYQRSLPNTIPTVRAPGGATPWQIEVEFWWRGAPKTVDYPGFSEGFFGRSYQLNGADWVLIWSVQPEEVKPVPDPGDQTWGEAQGDRADQAIEEFSKDLERTIEKAALPVGLIAAGGIGLYLWLTLGGSRRG